MKREYVAVIALLVISSGNFHAYAQDIIFPGETERPSRFPLNTTPETQLPNNQTGVITQEQYNNCVENCKFTAEYNPVCGSDGVTYQNMGALTCSINCGNPIEYLGGAPCSLRTTIPSTTDEQTEQTVITQEQYDNCINNCQFTSEYNPMCGSDGVAYQNIGALNCAIKCGNPIENLGLAPCDNYFNTMSNA